MTTKSDAKIDVPKCAMWNTSVTAVYSSLLQHGYQILIRLRFPKKLTRTGLTVVIECDEPFVALNLLGALPALPASKTLGVDTAIWRFRPHGEVNRAIYQPQQRWDTKPVDMLGEMYAFDSLDTFVLDHRYHM